MADRSYDGDPIDMTHTHLSEINSDGEDVEYATDAEGRGEMSTENVPMPGDDPDDPDGTEQGGDDDRDITEDDVREIRQRLLDGETTQSVAEDYNHHQNSVWGYARGDRQIDPDNPPALRYQGSGNYGRWVTVEDNGKSGGGQTQLTDGKDVEIPADGTEPEQSDVRNSCGDAPQLNDDVVVQIRQQLLDGETVAGIADDYELSSKVIRNYVKGRKPVDPDEPPALVYDGRGGRGGWVVPEDNGKAPTDAESEQTADNADTSTVTEATPIAPEINTDTETSDDRAILEGGLTVLTAFVAGWLLSRWLGGGD